MPRARVAAWLAAASLCLCLPMARAGEPDAPHVQTLTLAGALSHVLAGNPELAAQGYALRAADARSRQAAARPNPELNLAIEDFAGSGAVRGFTASEFTLTLSQLVELGGKRARRVEAAQAERATLDAARAVQSLDLLGEATRRFIDVAAGERRIALADEAVRLAEATEAAVRTRVQAARSPLAEGARARIALARARLDAAQARSQFEADRYGLAALWGAGVPDFEGVAADLDRLPDDRGYAALSTALDGNPQLAAYLSEARLRDAELRLAQSKRIPDFSFGGGLRRLQQGGDVAAVASFSIPLPVADRNAGGIAEAQALREQVDAQAQATRLALRTELQGLYRAFVQARTQATELAMTIEPASREALAQTEYAWQRGRYSYLEWADAQREWLAIRAQRLEASADCHRLLAAIERLTGEPLARSAASSPPPSPSPTSPPPASGASR